MEILDSGKDKVKKICDTLKKQTLDPAKQEAKHIVDHALKEADKIVKQAKEEARHLVEEQKIKLLQEKKAFYSSLNLAGKQTLEALKQEVEEHLFHKNISTLMQKATHHEDIIASFINTVVMCLEKEGLDSNLEILIPKHLSKQKVLENLSSRLVQSLKEHQIHIGDFHGGAKIKLKDHHIVFEMTDESLKALFSRFIREEFRSFLFDGKALEK
jgi:V/A-type H+-transporting ATPase subunit E